MNLSNPLASSDACFKEIHDLLVNDVLLVILKWQTAKELFGHSQERVDLLDRTAGSFFRACQSTFRDETFIGLSRLADPLKSVGRQNLCLDQLLENLDAQAHPSLAAELTDLIAKAKLLCEPCRQYRHRKLAHRDLTLLLASRPSPLPPITIEQVDNALKAIQIVLNTASRELFDSETYFDKIFQQGGVKSLTIHLERGERAFKEDDQAMLDRAGEHRPSPG